jgi:hypothetical protein
MCNMLAMKSEENPLMYCKTEAEVDGFSQTVSLISSCLLWVSL